ncbi:MAG TPA: hypothetical protein VH951_11590 [Dehalococcoidia bacterium]
MVAQETRSSRVAGRATPAGGRFYLALGANPAQRDKAIVRAFLWLKRRVEETGRHGILAVSPELQPEIARALGKPVADILFREGRMVIDYDRYVEWLKPASLPASTQRPVVVAGLDGPLERARGWGGPVLFVAEEAAAETLASKGVVTPADEDYTRPPRREC